MQHATDKRPLVYEGQHTPWGRADYAVILADGIGSVSTPSHGGIKLAPCRNRQVPDYMRQAGGWYEEDCEWSIPFVIFETDILLGGNAYAAAAIGKGLHKGALRNWFPEVYERFFGVTLAPGESYVRDQQTKHGGRCPWERPV